MKKYLLALLLLPTICFAQIKTEVNLGLDPVTGESGYQNKDTFRTIYFQGPALVTSGDTVSFAGSSGVWSLNGTKAYYLGYAGLGTTFPRSRFEVQTGYNTTVGVDSLGLMLSQSNPATFSVYNVASPPFVLETNGWNTTTSASQKSRWHIYSQGESGPGGSAPLLVFQYAKDTSTYLNALVFTGTTAQFYGLINGASAVFTGALTASQGVNFKGPIMFNYTGTGQTVVGNNVAGYPFEGSAILGIYSNGIQGMLLPKLTTMQRDSIGWTITGVAVANGGSGYSSVPNVTNNQAYLNPSAPAVNNFSVTNFFQGTASISGGAVTGVTIIKGGYFNGKVRLPVTGGGGTGAVLSLTMAQILPDGLLIYNSDIHAIQIWNGTSWVTNGYQSGTSTLASGTITVTAPNILATSRVILTYNTPSGTQGFLSAPVGSITAGTSFVINSSSGSDNSTVNWQIIN